MTWTGTSSMATCVAVPSTLSPRGYGPAFAYVAQLAFGIGLLEIAPVLRDRLATADAVLAGWVTAMDAAAAGGAPKLPAWIRNEMKTVETEIKYSGYLDQQRRSMEKMRKAEKRSIPTWFDYTTVSGLSSEMKEILARVRPLTLGQASRIAGVTPAAVSLIHVYIEIQGRARVA